MNDSIYHVRLELYRMLAATFFALPDLDFITMIRQMQVPDDGSEISNHIVLYQRTIANQSDEDVRQELRVDFARMLNGAVEQGARPPFESAYCNDDVLDLLKQLNHQYQAWGYGFASSHSEQSDHIAKELGFMQMLCERDLEKHTDSALHAQIMETEIEFMAHHLARWGSRFAREAGEAARTPFYQAVCQMLECHLADEVVFLNEQARILGLDLVVLPTPNPPSTPCPLISLEPKP